MKIRIYSTQYGHHVPVDKIIETPIVPRVGDWVTVSQEHYEVVGVTFDYDIGLVYVRVK